MKNAKTIGILLVFSFFLNACSFSNKAKSAFVTESNSNTRTVEKIEGSTEQGDIIFNKDKSLSCSLENWKLIGVFDNGNLITTQGEFNFKITNHDFKEHNWVLFELLILDKQGNIITTSNPFRDLQGEILQIKPSIISGKTRFLIRHWKYQNEWHDVKLKSCQWANSFDDYWKKYPELKNYLVP